MSNNNMLTKIKKRFSRHPMKEDSNTKDAILITVFVCVVGFAISYFTSNSSQGFTWSFQSCGSKSDRCNKLARFINKDDCKEHARYMNQKHLEDINQGRSEASSYGFDEKDIKYKCTQIR